MKLTKKQIHTKILTNQTVGILGGWMIMYFVFPLYSGMSAESVATVTTAIFFVWSYSKSYFIDILFESFRK